MEPNHAEIHTKPEFRIAGGWHGEEEYEFDHPRAIATLVTVLHGSLCPPGQIVSHFNRLLVGQN
jgi:hypothetical protein